MCRFLDTLESYLIDVRKMILQIYRQANERPAPFVDHTGTLRDARADEPIPPANGHDYDDEGEGEDLSGYVLPTYILLKETQLATYSSMLNVWKH